MTQCSKQLAFPFFKQSKLLAAIEDANGLLATLASLRFEIAEALEEIREEEDEPLRPLGLLGVRDDIVQVLSDCPFGIRGKHGVDMATPPGRIKRERAV